MTDEWVLPLTDRGAHEPYSKTGLNVSWHQHRACHLHLLTVAVASVIFASSNMPVGAQFVIGVWQPGGHVRQDTSFTERDVRDLLELGIDLLDDSTPRVNAFPNTANGQDFEEGIARQWPGRFVVYYEPENVFPWGRTLEHYAGDRGLVPLGFFRRRELSAKVIALADKWGAFPGFYGYRIGHEFSPAGAGIYDSAVYGNLAGVIDTIRVHDRSHRIIAIGDVANGNWTAQEREAFRQVFFRPERPANVVQHFRYYINVTDDSEIKVQRKLSDLTDSFDMIGRDVRTSLDEGRQAEWQFMVNAANQDHHRFTDIRYPRHAELKAQVYLALSRGAKGILYFLYTSSNGQVSGWVYTALVDYPDRNRIQPYWNNVRAVNDTLRILGDALYPLRWVDGFPESQLPPSTFVVGTSSDALEFGTFRDEADGNRDYLLVVNKKDVYDGAPRRIVNIFLDADQLRTTDRGQGIYFLTDILSGERQIHSTDSNGRFVLRRVVLGPGDARLYRIEKTNNWSGLITLTEDITVPADIALTIQPGTVVEFATHRDDRAAGFDRRKSELVVEGSLNAHGTPSERIIFRSTDTIRPTTADWLRIGVSGSATLSYCDIRDAQWGIFSRNAEALTVAHCTVTNCRDTGVQLMGSTGRLSGNTIYDCAYGIRLDESLVTVDHNLVYKNRQDGVHIRAATVRLINNTIHGSGNDGLYAAGDAIVTLRNTNITNSARHGIENAGATVNPSYTNVWGSAGADFFGMTDAAGRDGNLSTPGHYRDLAADNYILSGWSQLVDAGAPSDDYTNEPTGGTGRINIGGHGNTSQGASTLGGGSLHNGDFESELFPQWEHAWANAVSGQTWRRWANDHLGKNGTYYVSTCNQIQPGEGTCEDTQNETATGALRSNRFQVSDHYLNLLVAGFNGQNCERDANFVYLRRASNDEVLGATKAPCQSAFRLETWDLSDHLNEWVYIELLDGDDSNEWAWIAVDHFHFASVDPGDLLQNPDFESGALSPWTILSGSADGWEVKDLDMPHKGGTHFASTCDEIGPDGACQDRESETHTGILRSNTFVVTGGIMTYRLAGFTGLNCDRSANYAQVVRASDQTELRRTYVPCSNSLDPVTWNVGRYLGEEVYIELVDGDDSDSWAWIAADQFQTGSAKLVATAPQPYAPITNHPNPFNSHTVIVYELPSDGWVRLEIYDLLGQKIRTLVDGLEPAGQRQVVWDASSESAADLATGTYLSRLVLSDRVYSHKLILLR